MECLGLYSALSLCHMEWTHVEQNLFSAPRMIRLIRGRVPTWVQRRPVQGDCLVDTPWALIHRVLTPTAAKESCDQRGLPNLGEAMSTSLLDRSVWENMDDIGCILGDVYSMA